MNINYQGTWMSFIKAFLHLFLALSLGLLLGVVGEWLSWNRQDNFWLYLCLLGPLFLGIIVALIPGKRARSRWLIVSGAGALAWIGFYLTFVVIAFSVHPLSFPSSPDPSCSPCFDGSLFAYVFFGEFFPLGVAFVVITALATDWLMQTAHRNHSTPEESRAQLQTFSFNERTPLAFPLFRRIPIWLQVLVMLLSSLCLALGLTFYVPVLLSLLRLQVPVPFLALLVSFLFQGLLLAASTLLCGLFFGSWRGTLVCALSLAGSLLLPSFLHTGGSNPFSLKSLLTLTVLLPSLSKLCATFVVGLLYERRKYKNGLASFFTLLLGGTIVFAFSSIVDSSGITFNLFNLLTMCQISGMAVLIALGIEVLLQLLPGSRKRRLELTR